VRNVQQLFVVSAEETTCHTQFLCQNQVLIVCVSKNQVYTHIVQKMDTK
jgi:hypothetical protein